MKKLIIPLIISLFLISCGGIISPFHFDQETFNRERQLWLDQGIQNYSFRRSYQCLADSNASMVIVKNGNFAYSRSLNGREDDGLLCLPNAREKGITSVYYKVSVLELFTDIEKLAKEKDGKRVSIEIKYDSELHFPSYFYYDAHTGIPFYVGSGTVIKLSLSNFVLDPEIPEETSLFFDREAFTETRQAWTALGYQNYSFDFGYDDGNEANSWSGTVTVKNGTVIKSENTNFKPPLKPTNVSKTWVLPIDGIFAKIEAAADSYSTGGMQINIDYGEPSGNFIKMYYLYISPDTPAENKSYTVYVGDIKQLP